MGVTSMPNQFWEFLEAVFKNGSKMKSTHSLRTILIDCDLLSALKYSENVFDIDAKSVLGHFLGGSWSLSCGILVGFSRQNDTKLAS